MRAEVGECIYTFTSVVRIVLLYIIKLHPKYTNQYAINYKKSSGDC